MVAVAPATLAGTGASNAVGLPSMPGNYRIAVLMAAKRAVVG